MIYSHNFKGCRAFIHDLEGNTLLADTVLLTYDSERLLATIPAMPVRVEENDKVSVLILHKSAVFTFMGTIRKMDTSGNLEIALFRGTEKEDRKDARYKIDAPAVIECLIINQKLVPLHTPQPVRICNISQNGILVQIPHKIFNIGSEFQIKMDIKGSGSSFNASVKRVTKAAESLYEYGCALTGRG